MVEVLPLFSGKILVSEIKVVRRPSILLLICHQWRTSLRLMVQFRMMVQELELVVGHTIVLAPELEPGRTIGLELGQMMAQPVEPGHTIRRSGLERSTKEQEQNKMGPGHHRRIRLH